MAFTSNQHAQDVNTLLDFVLQNSQPGFGIPPSDKARDAAMRLAQASTQKLMAGITPKKIAEQWPIRFPDTPPLPD